ncbi:MAG TPA: peptidase [Stenotrophomonas sp.]|jgi:hypothetical protein|nr:peptidase [Stenotrophomonas sp.]
MARPVLLNNVDHRDLRIDARRGMSLGDGVMAAPTFPAEFRNVQSYYPIVFGRAGDTGFQPLALFGFGEGQNLFIEDGTWDAAYVPLSIQRQPFLIGPGHDGAALMHLDMDSPRVGRERGEPLFLEHGGNSAYLERMRAVLSALHEGLQATPAFVDALLRHRLLEPFTLDVALPDRPALQVSGFHAVAEERLRALDATALGALHQAGLLEPVFMAVASLGNLRKLVERLERGRG